MGKDINLVNDIEEKVKHIITKNSLIQNNDIIVVGVSGGPDSMCLLDVLYNLRKSIKEENDIDYLLVVAHVNHMIREESKEEKIYVENFCKKKDIPFYYKEENVVQNAKKNHMSEETYGRTIRYKFFEEVKQKTNAQKIALAHNLDDNVETILLNLIRGSGLKGLIGMSYSSNDIIRPLLDIEKKDILMYNNLRNLNPCFDKTNTQDIYKRNKFRLNLIPMLKNEYNSNIMENIIRMKHILELDEDFLEKYTNKILEKSIIENNKEYIKFNFLDILNEHESIKQRFVRQLIIMKKGNAEGVENVHILDIVKLLENNISKKKYILGKKFTILILKKNIAIIY